MIESLAEERGKPLNSKRAHQKGGANEDGCDLGNVAVRKKEELEVRAPGLRRKLKAHVSEEAGKPEMA